MTRKRSSPTISYQQTYQEQSVPQLYKTAMYHHRRGEIPQAEFNCRQILKIQHRHTGALYLLGLIGVQCGQVDAGISLLEKANKLDPRNPDICNTLGIAYRQSGKNEKAIDAFRQALHSNPEFAPAYMNLGMCLQGKGDLGAAATAYKKSLEYRPDNANALNNLGLVLQQQGRLDEAIDVLNKALDINPDAVLILTNLSAVYVTQKEFDKSRQLLDKAISLKPDYPDAYYNLGTLHQAQGELDEAQQAFEHAIELKPENPDAFNNLGLVYLRQDKPEQATDAFEKALELKPDFAEALNNIAAVLSHSPEKINLYSKKVKRAVAAFEKALELKPELEKIYENIGRVFLKIGRDDKALDALEHVVEANPDGKHLVKQHIGHLLMRLGHFDEAEQQFDELQENSNHNIEAVYNKVQTKKYNSPEDEDIKQMEGLLREPGLEPALEMLLHFAMGKIFDDCKLPDKAFPHFARGNLLQSKTIDYKPEKINEMFARLMDFFDKDFFNNRESIGSSTDTPIFIVGMPRSGTTLTEQIIASHPKVEAAGELGYFPAISRQLAEILESDKDYPDCVTDLNKDTCEMIYEGYIEHVTALLDSLDGIERFTDKMPHNFLNLGLLAILLPKAHFIHCRRDPMDTCLSIFTKRFSGKHGYSTDLTELGKYYKQYERLMTHWHDVLPISIFDIQYEELLSDQERISRELIAHVGLEWDDRCLAFHETRRSVKTASLWQVRQPIYTSSRQRWKAYEPHLKSLIEALR